MPLQIIVCSSRSVCPSNSAPKMLSKFRFGSAFPMDSFLGGASVHSGPIEDIVDYCMTASWSITLEHLVQPLDALEFNCPRPRRD